MKTELKIPRFQLVAANFSHLSHYLKFHGISSNVDGVLADFGVSSHQFDLASRGFSITRKEGRLDMRMNQSQDLGRSGGFESVFREEALSALYFSTMAN